MSARDYIDDYDGEATEPEDSYEAIERDLLHASGQPLPFTVDGPANGDDSDDEDEASAEASPPTAPEAVQAINLVRFGAPIGGGGRCWFVALTKCCLGRSLCATSSVLLSFLQSLSRRQRRRCIHFIRCRTPWQRRRQRRECRLV
jgi:hypothetical protein